MSIENNNNIEVNYLDAPFDEYIRVDDIVDLLDPKNLSLCDTGRVIKPVGNHKILLVTSKGIVTTRPERLVRLSK